MNIVTVNGKTYNLPNGNLSVIGNIVYCNGKIVTDCDEFETIVVQGDNNTVSSDGANITVNGNANNVSTKSGDIEVMGSIHGNCKTVSGDIKAKQVNNNTNRIIADVETEGIEPQIYKIKKKGSWFKELLFKIFGEE